MKNLTIRIPNTYHVHNQAKESNVALYINRWMRWKKP